MTKLTMKKRQELLDHLVGNCQCEEEAQFTEDEMDTLNHFSDTQLLALNMASGDHEEDEEDDGESVVTLPVKKGKKKAVTPVMEDDEEDEEDEEEVQNMYTFNEDDLPDEILEDLQFARNMKKQKKDQLIATITSNKEGLFGKRELQSKSIDELTKIASYVSNSSNGDEDDEEQTPKSVFNRQSNKRPKRLGGHQQRTTNNAELDDVLDLPIMNFSSGS